jgi:tellurite resistance protein TerC
VDHFWAFIAFNVFVMVMLAVDLGLFHRQAHVITAREAAGWTAVWVALALIFGAGVYRFMGHQAGTEFLTGYLIEEALSVDNMFVFLLIFSYFKVPAKYQHRVLFWGILGALLMRGTMIGAGSYLITRFHWVIYIFGGFLVITGIRLAIEQQHNIEPEANPVLRLLMRVMPIVPKYEGQKFFTRQQVGEKFRLAATPLLVVLVLVETTDLVFALDSIPAIFAVTRDPFLVYTSNVFAILGLRSLYLLLAGVIHKFHYLQLGLSVVLVFVGTKMLLSEIYHIPIGLSLLVIATILAIAVGGSLLFPKKTDSEPPPPTDEPADSEESVPLPGSSRL